MWIRKAWEVIEKLAIFFLKIVLSLAKKEVTEEQEKAFLQFVKFGIIGVSNTLISYFLYAGSLMLMQKMKVFPKGDYLIAQVIAFVLSVAWSFFWNNKLVFVKSEGQERVWWKALMKTYVSYSFTGLFLNSVLLILFVQVMHMSEYIAPIINMLISVPINFLINKFWAFK